jgi:hypothetical protein
MRYMAFLAALAVCSWPCYADSKYLADASLPAEVKPFIEKNTRVLVLERADLDGDGRQDYIMVLEKQRTSAQDDDMEDGQRPMLLLVRDAGGVLKLARRNDKIILCEKCGGAFGDPFDASGGIEAKPKSFTVNHYGGSASRWTTAYRFNYSRIDHAWQLVQAQETTFHSAEPEKSLKEKIYKPPKDFGKIDFADFDPMQYLRHPPH